MKGNSEKIVSIGGWGALNAAIDKPFLPCKELCIVGAVAIMVIGLVLLYAARTCNTTTTFL